MAAIRTTVLTDSGLVRTGRCFYYGAQLADDGAMDIEVYDGTDENGTLIDAVRTNNGTDGGQWEHPLAITTGIYVLSSQEGTAINPGATVFHQ